MPGKFIVIDGTDGSGKTTQANLLIDQLRKEGYDPQMADFPQYNTKSAGPVEEYLSGKYGSAGEVNPLVASMFFAIDRYDFSFKLHDWLNNDKIVIANRYVSSNLGHQGAKLKTSKERREYWEWLVDIEYNLFKIPRPDLNIVLHVPSQISQALSQARHREDWAGKTKDIHEDDLNHLRAAESSYLELAKTYASFRLIECVQGEKIMSRETIAELVWREVKAIL